MKNTAEYLLKTEDLPGKNILETISRQDAAETLGLPGKWARTYTTALTSCPKCGEKLPPLSKKRQRRLTDKQLLISKLHIIVIEIYTRKCKQCFLILRPNTLQHGLLNIGDVTLVTLDVFFTLRNTVR